MRIKASFGLGALLTRWSGDSLINCGVNIYRPNVIAGKPNVPTAPIRYVLFP